MLTSKKGEFMYNSKEGGIIEELLFKPMNEASIEKAVFKIRNAITNHFTPTIKLKNIIITPNYEQRYYHIEIVYVGIFSEKDEKVSFFTDGKYENVNLEYIDVDFVEENLKNFCLLKKSSMEDAKLILNPDEDVWIWKEYRFINLTTSDSYFGEILSICNLPST